MSWLESSFERSMDDNDAPVQTEAIEDSFQLSPRAVELQRQCAAELRFAVMCLMNRGLIYAAKWAAELMTQVDEPNQPRVRVCAPQRKHSHVDSARRNLMDDSVDNEVGGNGAVQTNVAIPEVLRRPDVMSNAVVMAKTYFDLRQYSRAAYALVDYVRPPRVDNVEHDADMTDQPDDMLALFLKYYALYMAGEKRKQEEMAEKKDPMERNAVNNHNLKDLERDLNAFNSHGSLDAFGLFLYGLVLKDLGFESHALTLLVKSVNVFPWNWSCWQAITSLCSSRKIALSLQLDDHWMKQFWIADVLLQLHQHQDDEVLDLLDDLLQSFPDSAHVLDSAAMAHYNLQQYDRSQDLFQELRKIDPYRLEHMDAYSNILYVKEQRGPLSYLAHQVVKTNKFCPETCCVIGNYYSLKGQHEKAIVYFQRALRLDPSFLSACTLIGHEFVELQNVSKAVDSYRQAIQIDSRDYRAWYGLGQAFELLEQHLYSLYYYKKAAEIRPYDSRMWCALAACYERLGNTEDSIKCYRRAEGNGDREGTALVELAKQYEKQDKKRLAARCYRQVLTRHDTHKSVNRNDVVNALLFLTDFCKNSSMLEEAAHYANRLLEMNEPAAKRLLKEISLKAGSSML